MIGARIVIVILPNAALFFFHLKIMGSVLAHPKILKRRILGIEIIVVF